MVVFINRTKSSQRHHQQVQYEPQGAATHGHLQHRATAAAATERLLATVRKESLPSVLYELLRQVLCDLQVTLEPPFADNRQWRIANA